MGIWIAGVRSLIDLVVTLKELAELGVAFVSLTEALNLTTPTGRAMAGLPVVIVNHCLYHPNSFIYIGRDYFAVSPDLNDCDHPHLVTVRHFHSVD